MFKYQIINTVPSPSIPHSLPHCPRFISLTITVTTECDDKKYVDRRPRVTTARPGKSRWRLPSFPVTWLEPVLHSTEHTPASQASLPSALDSRLESRPGLEHSLVRRRRLGGGWLAGCEGRKSGDVYITTLNTFWTRQSALRVYRPPLSGQHTNH